MRSRMEPKKNLKIESKILGEAVLVVLWPPSEDTKLVNYTIDEVEELDRLSPAPEELRALHQAKKTFGGWMVPLDRQVALGLTNALPLVPGQQGKGGAL